MTWSLRDRELEAVLQLNAAKRYAYLIKKTIDQKRVWGLWRDEKWALGSDNAGQELIPVWPHEKYAALCVQGNWAGYQPRAIDITTWIEKWIPGMHRDNRSVAAFPTPCDKGVIIDPERMAVDMRQELSLYE